MKKIVVAVLVVLSLFFIKNIFNKKIEVKTLTKGSNIVFAEEKKTFKVCIDPGHGGYDSGAESYSGDYEKGITLKVAKELKKILEKQNIEVVLTRDSDNVTWSSILKEDLQARCDISNEEKADVFVSLHCNSEQNRNTSRGVETWCRFKNTDSEKLAESIQEEISSINWTKDRGLKYESDGELYVLKNTEAASVLVEMGFLSNKKDAEYITSKKGQEECAKAIAAGIINYKK